MSPMRGVRSGCREACQISFYIGTSCLTLNRASLNAGQVRSPVCVCVCCLAKMPSLTVGDAHVIVRGRRRNVARETPRKNLRKASTTKRLKCLPASPSIGAWFTCAKFRASLMECTARARCRTQWTPRPFSQFSSRGRWSAKGTFFEVQFWSLEYAYRFSAFSVLSILVGFGTLQNRGEKGDWGT